MTLAPGGGDYLVGQLAAVLAGQHHVGEQQVECLVSVQQAQRRGRILGLDHLVVQVPEDLAAYLAHPVVVLDNQDRLAAAAVGAGRLVDGDVRLLAVMTRQIEFDRRAFARFAVDFHMPAGLLHEAVNLAQAQARALAGFLGGENGSKARSIVSADMPTPLSGNRDQHVLAGRESAW